MDCPHEEITERSPKRMLSPEVIKVDTLYALTINPNDDHQYWKSSSTEDRLSDFNTYWQAYIQLLTAEIHCNTEVSKIGRLHYHGTISFKTQKNINDFYINNFYKLANISNVMITLISDLDGWEDYYCKASHMIKDKINTTDSNIKRLSYVEKHNKDNKLKYKVPIKQVDITGY